MKTIYKYPFEVAGVVKLPLDPNARILLVEDQNSVGTLWALIDTEAMPVVRKFHIFGTGHGIPNPNRLTHIASWQHNNVYVWHMFELKEE